MNKMKEEILKLSGMTEGCDKKMYSKSEEDEDVEYKICKACGNRVKKSAMKAHKKSCNG